jgi:hypothetical protein
MEFVEGEVDACGRGVEKLSSIGFVRLLVSFNSVFQLPVAFLSV